MSFMILVLTAVSRIQIIILVDMLETMIKSAFSSSKPCNSAWHWGYLRDGNCDSKNIHDTAQGMWLVNDKAQIRGSFLIYMALFHVCL